jgi:hypothetical protein
MGFFQDVGNWFGDITGANQANLAKEQQKAGQANEAAAGTTLGQIGGTSAGQFAQQAGQAGQALGNQMGQQAATMGTQQAMQAARTAGLNKGQAALEGGQQAGRLYTQGQQAGQGMGMESYGQGAQTQLGGATQQGNLGVNQMGGAQQGQAAAGKAGGGLLSAVGGLFGLKEGGIVEKPTKAVVGEAGPEAVLPLTKPDRMAKIIAEVLTKKGIKYA